MDKNGYITKGRNKNRFASYDKVLFLEEMLAVISDCDYFVSDKVGTKIIYCTALFNSGNYSCSPDLFAPVKV